MNEPEPIDDLGLCCRIRKEGEEPPVTFYTSETEIERLKTEAKQAAATLVRARSRKVKHPEENSWGIEYRLSREDTELFWKLERAAIQAEDTQTPAETRKKDLQTALAYWNAAQSNKLQI